MACRAQSSAVGMGGRLRSARGVVRAAVDADADGGSTLPTSGSPATISIQAGDVTLSSGNAAKAVLLYTDALGAVPWLRFLIIVFFYC